MVSPWFLMAEKWESLIKSKLFNVIFSLILIIAISIIDVSAHHEISFSFLYLYPVALLTLNAGLLYGILCSILCSALWIFADIIFLQGHPFYIHVFNMAL